MQNQQCHLNSAALSGIRVEGQKKPSHSLDARAKSRGAAGGSTSPEGSGYRRDSPHKGSRAQNAGDASSRMETKAGRPPEHYGPIVVPAGEGCKNAGAAEEQPPTSPSSERRLRGLASRNDSRSCSSPDRGPQKKRNADIQSLIAEEKSGPRGKQ